MIIDFVCKAWSHKTTQENTFEFPCRLHVGDQIGGNVFRGKVEDEMYVVKECWFESNGTEIIQCAVVELFN